MYVRELATQVAEVCQTVFTNASTLAQWSLIGGTNVAEDITFYKEHGANIVVATPGRLDDVLNRLQVCTV